MYTLPGVRNTDIVVPNKMHFVTDHKAPQCSHDAYLMYYTFICTFQYGGAIDHLVTALVILPFVTDHQGMPSVHIQLINKFTTRTPSVKFENIIAEEQSVFRMLNL